MDSPKDVDITNMQIINRPKIPKLSHNELFSAKERSKISKRSKNVFIIDGGVPSESKRKNRGNKNRTSSFEETKTDNLVQISALE